MQLKKIQLQLKKIQLQVATMVQPKNFQLQPWYNRKTFSCNRGATRKLSVATVVQTEKFICNHCAT
jgi:hypothetical protein